MIDLCDCQVEDERELVEVHHPNNTMHLRHLGCQKPVCHPMPAEKPKDWLR